MNTEKINALKEARNLSEEEAKLCSEEFSQTNLALKSALDNDESKEIERLIKESNKKERIFIKKIEHVLKARKELNKELNRL